MGMNTTNREDEMAFHLGNDVQIESTQLSDSIKEQLIESGYITVKRLTNVSAQELYSGSTLDWGEILDVQLMLTKMGLSLLRWSPLDEAEVLNFKRQEKREKRGQDELGVSQGTPEPKTPPESRETTPRAIPEDRVTPKIELDVELGEDDEKDEDENENNEKEGTVQTTMEKQRKSPTEAGISILSDLERSVLSGVEQRRAYQQRLRMFNQGRMDELLESKRRGDLEAKRRRAGEEADFEFMSEDEDVEDKPLHWTQRPENRERIRKRMRKMTRARKKAAKAAMKASSRKTLPKAGKKSGRPKVNQFKFNQQTAQWQNVGETGNHIKEVVERVNEQRVRESHKDFLTGFALSTVTAELDKLAAQSNGVITAEELASRVGKLLLGYQGWSVRGVKANLP